MPDQWSRFLEYFYSDEALGFSLDISRMRFPADFFQRMAKPMEEAHQAMAELEAGAIANPTEGRMVGHYWLRAPELAPTPELAREISETLDSVRNFAACVHRGAVMPQRGGRFRNLLVVGIGGSALGPQLVADALGSAAQPMRPYFLDNTDPNGMARIFDEIGDGFAKTLTLVVSKSGGTQETRNGMLATEAAFRRAGVDFARHAVAVTGAGSALDRLADGSRWLRRFPMWDWVGGRTSLFSAVGMLPAALLGFDVEAMLRGAREMDVRTRNSEVGRNPAALLALMWHHAGNGRGDRDMVVLPYQDRLQLFAKYLQQLVMESLGKELDLRGSRVNQGIVVYGNKGSTDQHAYVQQLRDGPNNFFATFIEVLYDGERPAIEARPGVTPGDYLGGFLQGTREALAENERESVTLTVERLDAAALGILIALYERAVGLYASLIGVNAYDQPGVEAGKKAAEEVLRIQDAAAQALRDAGRPLTAEEAARAASLPERTETVYHVLRHLAANPGRGVERLPGEGPASDRFQATS